MISLTAKCSAFTQVNCYAERGTFVMSNTIHRFLQFSPQGIYVARHWVKEIFSVLFYFDEYPGSNRYNL